MPTVAHLVTTWVTTGGDATAVGTPAVGDLIAIVTSFSGSPTADSIDDNNAGGGGQYDNAVVASAQSHIWIRKNFITSATSTTFTARQTGSSGGGLSVYTISGMKRSGSYAVRQTGFEPTSGGSGTPVPKRWTTAQTDNPLVGAVRNGSNPAAMTPPTGWTEGFDNGFNTPTSGLETVFRSSGETLQTITWGSSSASAWNSVVAELDA